MKRAFSALNRHRADIIIIALILAAALVIYLFSQRTSDSITAEILQDGKLLYTYELDIIKEPQTLTLDGGIKILIKDGSIGFISADCPDKTCVKSGMLTKAGQTAVCVPNKAVIRLHGKDSGAPDIISY